MASHQINRRLYWALSRELPRILRPAGRAIILTLERRLMSEIFGSHEELRIVHMRRLSYGGLEPSLYIIKPK